MKRFLFFTVIVAIFGLKGSGNSVDWSVLQRAIVSGSDDEACELAAESILYLSFFEPIATHTEDRTFFFSPIALAAFYNKPKTMAALCFFYTDLATLSQTFTHTGEELPPTSLLDIVTKPGREQAFAIFHTLTKQSNPEDVRRGCKRKSSE